MAVRVLLADDHTLVRQGLRAVLEREGIEVVGEASDGREAIQLCERLHPDVAVLDVSMPLLNGIDAAHEIGRSHPRTKTVLLTMHTEDIFVLQGLRSGVSGFVLKQRSAEELVRAIREVSRGEIFLSAGICRTVVHAYVNKTELPTDPLSDRERQVLQLVAEGKTNQETASILDISPNIAEFHSANIMEKLDIHDTAGLVRYAIQFGLIDAKPCSRPQETK
ncbi:MAG TPA: response regulator transcription factor [Terriglobales bacterium]|nr:response regulator transcription factor [Terriglobales bacterium]